MDSLKRPFTEHPDSVGESYLEHLGTASVFGVRLLIAGLACLVHGLLPFLFEKTSSRTIAKLHHRMVTHRCKMHGSFGRDPAPQVGDFQI